MTDYTKFREAFQERGQAVRDIARKLIEDGKYEGVNGTYFMRVGESLALQAGEIYDAEYWYKDEVRYSNSL